MGAAEKATLNWLNPNSLFLSVIYSHQPIFDIAQICARHGVRHCVTSPGSRSAPLTIAFARHPDINTLSISDERSAAFVALGLAQSTRSTVALVCTSGTATLNFAPAIAEAYYAGVGLLILTADRPPEWIDQWDGQTIRQQHLYANYIRSSYQLPDSYHHPDQVWHLHRLVNQAIAQSRLGPVHINVPLREPFYPSKNQELNYSDSLPFFELTTGKPVLSASQIDNLSQQLRQFTKILVAIGQSPGLNFELPDVLTVVADVISNVPRAIGKHDWFLGAVGTQGENLRPDLLITMGKSFISKNLKLFIRKYKPKAHWHIDSDGHYADPFQCLSQVIVAEPKEVFESLEWPENQSYKKLWWDLEIQTVSALAQYEFDGEMAAVRGLLSRLEHADLHLANSMSVRYANFFGVKPKVRVFANRGTSGIDGSTSTAVGHCLGNPNRLQVLITGDVAFFYDRNAFWNNLEKNNLRILLLNNGGGVIFGMIDGPAQQKEAQEFFITRQLSRAKSLSEEFGLRYLYTEQVPDEMLWDDFLYGQNQPTILEMKTQITKEISGFQKVKNYLAKYLHYRKS